MSDYYTVTMDYLATGEGHRRAIMIVYANDEEDARFYFAQTFGSYFASGANVVEGIHIENGYQDLITDAAKKIILKVKSKSLDAPPLFSYSNSIFVNYC